MTEKESMNFIDFNVCNSQVVYCLLVSWKLDSYIAIDSNFIVSQFLNTIKERLKTFRKTWYNSLVKKMDPVEDQLITSFLQLNDSILHLKRQLREFSCPFTQRKHKKIIKRL